MLTVKLIFFWDVLVDVALRLQAFIAGLAGKEVKVEQMEKLVKSHGDKRWAYGGTWNKQ